MDNGHTVQMTEEGLGSREEGEWEREGDEEGGDM